MQKLRNFYVREFRKAKGSIFESPWPVSLKGHGQHLQKAISQAILYNTEARSAIGQAVDNVQVR